MAIPRWSLWRWSVAAVAVVAAGTAVACGRAGDSAAAGLTGASAAGGASLAVAGMTVAPGGGTVKAPEEPGAPPALTVEQVFNRDDTDHDGFINRAEWRNSGRHSKNFDARDVREPFNLLDLDEFRGARG